MDHVNQDADAKLSRRDTKLYIDRVLQSHERSEKPWNEAWAAFQVLNGEMRHRFVVRMLIHVQTEMASDPSAPAPTKSPSFCEAIASVFRSNENTPLAAGDLYAQVAHLLPNAKRASVDGAAYAMRKRGLLVQSGTSPLGGGLYALPPIRS